MKVLIVEDNDDYINLLNTEFELAGFEVVLAHDGLEGIEQAKNTNPDIILLDIILSKTLGFSLLRQLKKDDQIKSVPVVAMSNYSSRENEEKVNSLGAVKFIDKGSYKPSQIVEEIRQILERGKSM